MATIHGHCSRFLSSGTKRVADGDMWLRNSIGIETLKVGYQEISCQYQEILCVFQEKSRGYREKTSTYRENPGPPLNLPNKKSFLFLGVLTSDGTESFFLGWR